VAAWLTCRFGSDDIGGGGGGGGDGGGDDNDNDVGDVYFAAGASCL
jgi:hypothetical protein